MVKEQTTNTPTYNAGNTVCKQGDHVDSQGHM